MFHVGRFRLFDARRRALRRERVFRDRTKPLDIYDDFELIDKYRFDRQSIMMICDMLQDDLESSTFTSSLAKGYDSGPPSLHPWQI